jgi:hypothetical protein
VNDLLNAGVACEHTQAAHRSAPEISDQQVTLWKFDVVNWLVLQVVDWQLFRSWLAALDDFRNWLIREAA